MVRIDVFVSEVPLCTSAICTPGTIPPAWGVIAALGPRQIADLAEMQLSSWWCHFGDMSRIVVRKKSDVAFLLVCHATFREAWPVNSQQSWAVSLLVVLLDPQWLAAFRDALVVSE